MTIGPYRCRLLRSVYIASHQSSHLNWTELNWTEPAQFSADEMRWDEMSDLNARYAYETAQTEIATNRVTNMDFGSLWRRYSCNQKGNLDVKAQKTKYGNNFAINALGLNRMVVNGKSCAILVQFVAVAACLFSRQFWGRFFIASERSDRSSLVCLSFFYSSERFVPRFLMTDWSCQSARIFVGGFSWTAWE